jgi:hypothetical protein
LLDLHQVRDTTRYDSVKSTEGDLGTHHDSTNKTPQGQRVCDIMHPRLKARAKEWGSQYVQFGSECAYPMFIATLTKARDAPPLAEEIGDDAYFDKAYAQAVRSNGRPFRFSRLCLIGEGRAGKTALANALCDRTWVETDSTIGVGLNPHLHLILI